MAKKQWGFDTRTIDKAVRPQDDFYRYAHGKWLAKAKIPPQESRWGAFSTLRLDTEKKVQSIVQGLKGRYPAGSPGQMIRDFYRSGMDEARREKLGLVPLLSWLARAEQVMTKEDLLTLLADMERAGMGGIFGVMIDQDSKKSTRYLVHLYQSGLGLPDRDYYLKEDAESLRVRKGYEQHIEALLRLVGDTPAEQRKNRQIIMNIETALAKASMSKEDVRNPDKVYNKFSLAKLGTLAPQVDWRQYFSTIGAGKEREVILMTPDFLATASRMLDTVSIEEWKTYLRFHLINGSASALSKKFVNENFSFYGKVLSGQKKLKPLWRRSLGSTSGALGELVGQLYVKQHFTPEAKKRMNGLINDLFATYADRIKRLDWMSAATKKRALAKLRLISRKIGYPDKWKSYRGLIVRPDEYFNNLLRSAEFEHNRQMKKLGRPIDRGEWLMYPQMVNAYYSPSLNDIAFPAAILQPPFFSLSADDAVNYGSIGSVIGHELTHAFDDQGSKFDGHGNLKGWWTPQDKRRFEAKAKLVKEQFDGYMVADGLKVNGQLTLGENIADLGGASIAYNAYQRHLRRLGKRRSINGFTPEQRFFLGFALFERELSRPEFVKMQVLTDPHSPGIFRINGPVSNMEEFYTAFGVKKGDKLYREPKSRAKIW
jgi:putative endopeptidase